ncbi:MAG: DUF2795 domain-containing protein [Rubrobacter sp.]|nr:DUF2795 domain-containing protein [Rubrobacter sp.]
MDNLSNFNPADVKQHLEGIDWPADREEIAKKAEQNGAPGPVAGQLRQRLPEGEISGPQDVVSKLQG